MARFDIYRNPQGEGYLLDIQADILGQLNTRLVVPLLPPEIAPEPAKKLNPVFEIDGQPAVMATQFLAAAPVSALSEPLGNAEPLHQEINDAIDFLMQGM